LSDGLETNRVLEVVEARVNATFHQAKCGGSFVINDTLDSRQ